MFDTHKVQNGDRLTIFLEGRLDSLSAGQFEEELSQAMKETTDLELNLEKLEIISSVGLRVFLYAQNVMDERGSMVITHMNERIREIFEVTGFSGIMTIE